MALVDTLEHMLPGTEIHAYLVRRLQAFAAGLTQYQAACGAFHLYVDEAESPLP